MYVFTHDFYRLMPDDGMRAVELHGLHLDIRSWQELPADVATQYRRARIRVRALLRMNAAAVAALAWTRPRKAAKAAA